MASDAYTAHAPLFGTSVPNVWNPATQRSLYGDAAVVLFLLAQCLDGVLTYVGVMTLGVGIEANPIIVGLMLNVGHGVALAGAKGVAAALGICLHLRQLHNAVALLAGFYVAVAIVPWTAILFF